MTGSIADAYPLALSDAELERYRMMAEHARAEEADLWTAAGIVAGASVADVGCGPGAMFPAIVSAVGSTGNLVGVDGDPVAASHAQALVTANGWPNARVQVGKADATGIEPGSVDAVMMRHVLAHNGPTEQQIVNHLATLVRPGGCVYLVDILGSAFATRPDDRDVDDLNEAYRRFHAAKGNDLRTGTRLDGLLEQAGLDVVRYRGWYNIVRVQGEVRPPSWAAREAMIEAGIATVDDVSRWGAALDRIVPQSPTIFAPMFGAVARRPT